MQEFTTDIAVALDSWVGMVHMVKCRLVMVCSDGSRCIMSDGEALELDDLRDTRDRVRLVTVSQAHGHLFRTALCPLACWLILYLLPAAVTV